MSFIKNILSGKNKSNHVKNDLSNYKNIKKESKITYNPELIEKLKSDHEKLGSIYSEIFIHYKNNEFDKLKSQLSVLKITLQSHVLVENIQFYTYLEEYFKEDKDNAETIHEFKYDMNVISRQIIKFIKKWLDANFDSIDEYNIFLKEYNEIKTLLENRFDNEENCLYSLYTR